MILRMPLSAYRQLDKTGWTETIPKWCRRYGYVKQIPRAISPNTSLMTRKEAKNVRSSRKQPIHYQPALSWSTVPQRLPYRKEGEEMIVDQRFLDMVEIWKKTRTSKALLPPR